MKCTCDLKTLERIHRSGWMRLIPGLRRYYCDWHQKQRLHLRLFK